MGGLKRHTALQPFSRDHLIGLFHAQKMIKLEKGANPERLEETVTAFEAAWKREISVHFADEDRLLGPLPLPESSTHRLHDEHVELTDLIDQVVQKPYSPQLCARVGKMLDAHIRWEEHELFPEIESRLSPPELEALGEKTGEVEKSRHRKL